MPDAMTVPVEVTPAVEAARGRLTTRLNQIINRLAARDDLILHCVWEKEPGHPDAPAWFTPATGEVTVMAPVAIGDTNPDDVEPRTVAGRGRHPELIGLCSHEAAHAHSTRWDEDMVKAAPPAVQRAAVLLEEPRIEARQVRRRPMDRPFLRAQSVLIDLAPLRSAPEGATYDRWGAATVALLVGGRVDAGVLDAEDAEVVLDVVRAVLGDDLDALADLWCEAIDLADGDTVGLLDVAARWVDVLGEPEDPRAGAVGCAVLAVLGGAGGAAGDNPGDGEWYDPENPLGDAGDPGRGGGGAEGEAKGGDPLMNALMAAVGEMVEAVHEDAVGEVGDAVAAVLEGEAAQAAALADLAAHEGAKRSAQLVFKSGHAGGYAGRGTADRARREPTALERTLARQVGMALRKARFRERSLTVRSSAIPPGRLVGRDLMLGAAQAARGGVVTAEPFRQKVRRHVPEPPLTLGIMVDESGSMAWAVEPMSTTAWVMAHAVTYVQGTCASVGFEHQVTPVVAPGKPPSRVTTFKATGSYEAFRAGFEALDGALNLTMGRGVRALVVVSDGQYMDVEWDAAVETVARMNRNGGHVLWFNMGNARVPDGAIEVRLPKGAGAVQAIPEALTAALAGALRG